MMLSKKNIFSLIVLSIFFKFLISKSFKNNFSLNHIGIDILKELNPQGIVAKYVSNSLSNFKKGLS